MFVALAVLSVLGLTVLFNGMSNGNINAVVAIFGIIFCFAAAIICAIDGIIAQIILVFLAGLGIANSEERGGNIAAFVIALLTVIGMIIGFLLIFKIL